MGEVGIGTIKPGNQVWAYNQQTKKMELEVVRHLWINHDNDLVDLTLTTKIPASKGKPAQLTSETVHTNKKHPFLTVEKGFLPVAQLKLGMHVVEAGNRTGVVTGWKSVSGVQTMYNLEVTQDHTFVVGVGQFVVHNTNPVCSGTAGQAANSIANGSTEVTVKDRPEAEKFFLKYLNGRGFGNATGMGSEEAKNYFGNNPFYHWDDTFDEDGNLANHDPQTNPHAWAPHLQIHPDGSAGKSIHIFYNP